MKVLLVTPGRLPIPANLGGAIEEYILSLGRELVLLGVDVQILDISRSSSDRSPKTEVLQGVKIIRIPKYALIPIDLKSNNILTRSKKLLDEFIWGFSVKKFMEAHLRTGQLPWDIVHFNSPIPLIVNSKLLTKNRIKIAYTEHIYSASKPFGTWFYRKVLEPKIESMILSSATTIALSKSIASSLMALRKSIVYLIPLGVDTRYFYPLTNEEREKAFNLLLSVKSKASFIITYVGRIHREKGIDVLIKAIKNLKDLGVEDFILILAGPLSGDFSLANSKPSSYTLEIMKMIEEYKLQRNVIFLGGVRRDHTILLFNISSVFVLPSHHETFGLAALEAMAAGVPVVGTKVGALPDIIKNDFNGYLFETGNSEELSSILMKLYKDRECLRKLSKNAKESAKEYSWKKIAEQTYNVYKKLLTY
jgi:glycosyltransferase involved in cell wall biosynthesis